MPLQPDSHLPHHNLADAVTVKNKVYATQVLDQMPRPVADYILTSIEALDSRRADLYTVEGRLDKTIRCILVFFVCFFRDPLQALINSNECGRDLAY